MPSRGKKKKGGRPFSWFFSIMQCRLLFLMLHQVLDDNRELFIAETQELVKASPNFMLFGTQNPPGAYGGRKVSEVVSSSSSSNMTFNVLSARVCLRELAVMNQSTRGGRKSEIKKKRGYIHS